MSYDSANVPSDGYCPACREKGKLKALKTYRISFQESVFLCEDLQCIYPLGFKSGRGVAPGWDDCRPPRTPQKRKAETSCLDSLPPARSGKTRKQSDGAGAPTPPGLRPPQGPPPVGMERTGTLDVDCAAGAVDGAPHLPGDSGPAGPAPGEGGPEDLEDLAAQAPCVQWENAHALCWLHCVLVALVHLRALPLCASGDSLFRRLLQAFRAANGLLRGSQLGCAADGECKKPNSEIFRKIQTSLNEIRDDIFTRLQPQLRCTLGDMESPVFAFPLLLRTEPRVEDLFTFSFSWNFECSQCGHTYQNRCTKTLVTFTNVVPEWHPLNAAHVGPCNRCGNKPQRRRMVLERLSAVFMLHFVEGLPQSDLEGYAFPFQGCLYQVSAVIQYQAGSHFVTWVSRADGSWLECDDLKGPISRRRERFQVPAAEVHIVIWERRPPPAAGQTVPRLPAAVTGAERRGPAPVTSTEATAAESLSGVQATDPCVSLKAETDSRGAAGAPCDTPGNRNLFLLTLEEIEAHSEGFLLEGRPAAGAGQLLRPPVSVPGEDGASRGQCGLEGPPEGQCGLEGPPEGQCSLEGLPEGQCGLEGLPEGQCGLEGPPEGQCSLEGFPEGQCGLEGPPEGQCSLEGPPEGQCGLEGPPQGQCSLEGPPEGQCSLEGTPESQCGLEGPPEGQCSLEGTPKGQCSLEGTPEGQCGLEGLPVGQCSLEGTPEGHCSLEGPPEGQCGLEGPPKGQCGLEGPPEGQGATVSSPVLAIGPGPRSEPLVSAGLRGTPAAMGPAQAVESGQVRGAAGQGKAPAGGLAPRRRETRASTAKSLPAPSPKESPKKPFVGSWVKGLLSRGVSFMPPCVTAQARSTVADLQPVKGACSFGGFRTKGASQKAGRAARSTHRGVGSTGGASGARDTPGVGRGSAVLAADPTGSVEAQIHRLRLKLLKKLKAKKKKLAALSPAPANGAAPGRSPSKPTAQASPGDCAAIDDLLEELQCQIDMVSGSAAGPAGSGLTPCSDQTHEDILAELLSPASVVPAASPEQGEGALPYLEMGDDHVPAPATSGPGSVPPEPPPRLDHNYCSPSKKQQGGAGPDEASVRVPGLEGALRTDLFDEFFSCAAFESLASDALDLPHFDEYLFESC